MATTSTAERKDPETLAERFWSVARVMDPDSGSSEPEAVVRHVLAVLDAFEEGAVGDGVTANTLSFLTLLRQHEVRGDLLYASPEQARGESVDERSLVFSAGVLLFEKLTGRHPFGAEGNPKRLARIRRGEMASGVNYFPRVPAALRTVLVTSMGPFPEERYRNLAELRSELEAFVGASRADDAAATVDLPLPGTSEARTPSRSRRGWSETAEVLAPRASTATSARRASRRTLASVAWMVVGAALASVGWVSFGRAGLGTEPARAAGGPAADTTASGPVVTSLEDADPAVAVSTDDTTAGAAAHEPGAPAPQRAAFDPDRGGERALAAALTCFSADRRSAGVQFGASLVYGTDTGASRRVYYGAVDAVTTAEQQCLNEALRGISAGAPPDAATVVTYSFWIDHGGGRVRATGIER